MMEEVSRGTSVSSLTVDHHGKSEPQSSQSLARRLDGNGESAAMSNESKEEPSTQRFECAAMTEREQKESKALYDAEHYSSGQADGAASSERSLSVTEKLHSSWCETINHEDATIPLAWQTLLTGLVDALLYTRGTIWTGFQTGNMVQFSENIAQYMFPNEEHNPLLTLLRALSFSSFFLGSLIGARLGSRFGDKKRGWIVSSSIIQSIFLFGASAILLSRPASEPPSFQYWPGVVVMTAFSMGMQSIAAQKLVSPSFATTVAFTASLTQVASDPYLFALTLSPIEQYQQKQAQKRELQDENIEAGQKGLKSMEKSKPPKTLGRDRRLLALVALCTGGGVAQCLLFSRADLRGGLTIAAGFKMIQAVSFKILTNSNGQTVHADSDLRLLAALVDSTARAEVDEDDKVEGENSIKDQHRPRSRLYLYHRYR